MCYHWWQEEAEKITQPILDALGEDYSTCCEGTDFTAVCLLMSADKLFLSIHSSTFCSLSQFSLVLFICLIITEVHALPLLSEARQQSSS